MTKRSANSFRTLPRDLVRSRLLWALLSGAVSTAVLLWLAGQQELLEERSFSFLGRTLELSDGKALFFLALVPLLLFGVGRSLADLPWQQRVLSFLLRAGFFAAVAFGMGRPTETEEVKRICTVALVDVSMSVSDAALNVFREELVELVRTREKEDELRLLAFAADAGEVELAIGEPRPFSPPSLSTLRESGSGAVTDIGAALELASAWTRSDCVSRYVLYSDGIETRGDAFSSLSGLERKGIRLFVKPLVVDPPQDVALVGLSIPEGVRVGEPFSIRVRLLATKAVKGQLRLYQGKTLNGLDGVREIDVPKGESSQEFQSVIREAGDVSYRAEFQPKSADKFYENNQYTSSVEVPGPPRVLLVDRNPDQAGYLAQALVAQQLDVDLRRPAAMPQTLAEISQFQFVILSDLPYESVTRGAEALLGSYVRGGGGLLYSGGEAGYGPGGWDRSALKKILPVTMDSQKEREIPGVAMALVIDRSGSMTGLPIQMAKEACTATLGVLEQTDLIEVIAFDSRPNRFVKMQPARYRSRIESSVARIQPGGGTEIFASLDMAYQDLAATEARKKHIILLTDGNASSDGIYELASAAFAEGITITSVGLGGGVNRSLLTMISETGGGRFHPAEDPSRLPRIFTRETELISKKAAVNDWFPVTVTRGADFLKGVGIGAAPLLRGYTATQIRPAPAETILVSDRGDPILARKPVGLGWTLAWTSDLKSRWATDWLRWGRFGRLMAQMVREHQRTDDTEIRPMKVELLGDELVASLEAFDEQENFDSSLSSTLSVRLLGGAEKQDNSTSQMIRFRRVAPGLYQARTRLTEYGSYALKATHERLDEEGKGRSAGVSYDSISLPYPEEFADLEPRPSELQRWARATGGESDFGAQEVWTAGQDSVRARFGRQNDFIFLALVLFLLDLLFRRVRIFDRDFRHGTSKGAVQDALRPQ